MHLESQLEEKNRPWRRVGSGDCVTVCILTIPLHNTPKIDKMSQAW